MKKITLSLLIASASLMAGGVPASCNGCHGADGSRNTMVKDSIPNTLAKAEIVSLLHGYKDGTVGENGKGKYGKGALMKNFSKNLTDQQINDIANAWGK